MPASRRIPEVMKPGDTRGSLDGKFASASTNAPAPDLDFDPYRSVAGATMQRAVKRSDYKVPDRRGVMATNDRRPPPPRRFIARSTYQDHFEDFMAGVEVLSRYGEEEYRRAFDALDTDGSGSIERSEVATLFRRVMRSEPPKFAVDQFMLLFDRNKDDRVSWDEFKLGLERVRKQTEAQVPREVSKRSEPVWMKESAPRVIGRGPLASTAQRDIGEYGMRPTERPLVEGSGMKSTTLELDAGTAKHSRHLPNYGGFIPNVRHNPVASAQAEALKPRDSLRKVLIRSTYSHNAPGYTGHAPAAAHIDRGPVKPTELTTTGAMMREVERMWEARRTAASGPRGSE
eukprot:CAMPEP_0196775998 /NCGR_PEP_ID=MMETSP1104-20130614/4366_1 /TAXON_ID=33652 /ORGANISM="Cafeteria sp., Strain Caron Lab Isolate" /LENGTH=343 /DNA_ID=CAMNT_0042146169 /DNA_START=1 /DNA_END=1032 /DNA_ORIENTATION=+